MIDIVQAKEWIKDKSEVVQDWIYRKVFASIDVPENLEFLFDVAVARRRFLTAFMLLIVKLVYRVESAIAHLFGGKL